MLDYEQYRVNLTATIDSNAAQFELAYTCVVIMFRFLASLFELSLCGRYRARALYGMPDLSPTSWSALIDRMTSNDTLFNVFHDNYCTGTCADKALSPAKKKDILCHIRGTTPADVAHCIKN